MLSMYTLYISMYICNVNPPFLGREKGSLTITNMHVVNNYPANDPNWSAALDNLDHLFLVMKSVS